MSKPRWIDIQAPSVELKALTWGPSDGPIALCLHGFPTPLTAGAISRRDWPSRASGWWRRSCVAMRRRSRRTDGSYHVGALMHDALQVRAAAGGTDRDVVIGHDWGAMAANGLAAIPGSPFAKAVMMSVPPAAAFRRRVPDTGRLLAQIPPQPLRSWYMMYFQLPWLPERSASWILPRLWKRWSPGYDAKADLRHVDAAIGTPESWRAALGPYRATIRNTRPPTPYRDLHRHWISAEVAELVPSRTRRRLYDIGFHPLDTRRPSRRQRRERRRQCRTLPATRPAGQSRRLGVGFHRLGPLRAATPRASRRRSTLRRVRAVHADGV
jgi:pimeloyl-ACP methyl ester carboxylesterase